MKDLTYERYVSDLAVREELEEEVRRLHHEAIDRYIVAPIKGALRRLRRRHQAGQAPAPALSRDSAIETTVAKGCALRIEDAKGFEIKVVSGCLWITQQNDTADYVLKPYETFRVSRNGTTLVHAMKVASLRIAYPAKVSVPIFSFGRRFREFGATVGLALSEWLRGVRNRVASGARADVPQVGEPV
ncbi:MAG TPA: DUF2917 domain-containing protein [Burkholderiaceae bacterium]|nr:DUF2917 domain-containing protein [Burkholderiaceae bacterium]